VHRTPAAPTDTRRDLTAWAHDALASTNVLPGVWRMGLALAEGGGRRLRFTASDRDTDAGLWTATSSAGSVEDGLDSYVIRDGRIQAQTIHYTLTPS
jgi:hypothetical protein